ncbi:MAG TPA: DUF99 family protein [Ignisphaera aggregans]|uniref:UPF0215 protein EYH02_02530 n=1 Tax=Ignisphaera aggregans TaxID=334771 RepID=A0A832Z2X8_9CREN|nr:DUF99 family protein [Ignisphaera aggregans]
MLRYCSIGLDDGYFAFEDKKIYGKTVLVGTITTVDRRILDVLISFITIDGLDAISQAMQMVEKAVSRYGPYLEVVFLDGVTYAGFNIIDPLRLHNMLNIPVIVVFRHELDLKKVLSALRAHFVDWKYRYKVIEQTYRASHKVRSPVRGVEVRITVIGVSVMNGVKLFFRYASIYPEPYCLRVADRIASSLGKTLHKYDESRRR